MMRSPRSQRDALLATGDFFRDAIRTAGVESLARSLRTTPAGVLRELRDLNGQLEALARYGDSVVGDPPDYVTEVR